MTELATTDQQTGLALGFVNLTASDLNALDTDKLQALLEMKRTEEERMAEREFNRSLVKFQRDCPQIAKDKEGHNARYASYEGIRRAVDPILAANGFAVTFGALNVEDGKATMTGTLRHDDGHSHTETVNLPVDAQMRANDTQKGGSAASYCQRYLLRAMLGLVFTDEDDDGQAAGTATVTEDQAQELRELTDQVEDYKQLERFYQWLQVESVEAVPARKFEPAREALDRIIKKQEK